MNNLIKIAGSIFFIIILSIVPNIQATEINLIKEDIEEQIQENFLDNTIGYKNNIWDLLEFLFALLLNLIDFIIDLLRIFVNLMLIPLSFINYIIWAILQIIFPH